MQIDQEQDDEQTKPDYDDSSTRTQQFALQWLPDRDDSLCRQEDQSPRGQLKFDIIIIIIVIIIVSINVDFSSIFTCF